MKTKRTIYITRYDRQRLEDQLVELDKESRKDLQSLEVELNRAKIVDSKEVPPDVVTMNSRLMYRDLEDDSEEQVTLVFPSDADINRKKMSVFSPLGTALLGYAEGDTLEWQVPGGRRKIRIEKIYYQPEAAGDLNV